MTSDDLLGVLMLGLLFVLLAVMVSDSIKTRRIYKRMEEAERTPVPPICADTNAPKWPGNCWNVRCQLGGTCCRADDPCTAPDCDCEPGFCRERPAPKRTRGVTDGVNPSDEAQGEKR